MNTPKLTRKQIKEGLDQVPFIDIMGGAVNTKLTNKQKVFAMELAKGAKGSEAYRKAYNSKGKAKTQADQAHRLRKRPDIKAVTEAYSKALEAEKYQTPAALRALVIQSLVSVIIDEEANHSQVVAAAKVLGTVTEVAAFTERKEVTTITTSDAARAKVMAQLREMMNSQAEDASIIENEALSLEQELAATSATPHTPNEGLESHIDIHTIPLKQSSIPLKQSPENSTPHPFDNPTDDPENDDSETPPVNVSKPNGLG
jgi:hypothetical protein